MTSSFRFENTKPVITDEDLLTDIRRVAASLGSVSLSQRRYRMAGTYSTTAVKSRFGTWNSAVVRAGLAAAGRRGLAADELFDNLREVWIRVGRQPRKRDMVPPTSRFTHHPYIRHFGGWLQAVKAFLASLDAADVGGAAPSSASPPLARGPRDPSLRLRFLVMRRDRFKCRNCGRSPATHPDVVLHVDHVMSWVAGGPTSLENLQTLCSTCNLGKSSLPATAG